ncbi:MAG: hypothetical protein E6G01_13480 [Actinobacteria bacterium]|nr:MAG: hypothetical protein E6G01_13480 [Actinomycetota bacterium]
MAALRLGHCATRKSRSPIPGLAHLHQCDSLPDYRGPAQAARAPGGPSARTPAPRVTIRVMDIEGVRGQLGAEHDRLQALRDEFIEGGLTSQSEEDSLAELSSSAQHQADIGTETFDRERDVSILEQVEAELADVELALRRLDDGTYGTCEACGRVIGDSRLEAKPEARFCLDDQARAERDVRGPSRSS